MRIWEDTRHALERTEDLRSKDATLQYRAGGTKLSEDLLTGEKLAQLLLPERMSSYL